MLRIQTQEGAPDQQMDIIEMERGYQHAEKELQDVAHRLQRSMAMAAIQGSEEVPLPSAAQPAAPADQLGHM